MVDALLDEYVGKNSVPVTLKNSILEVLKTFNLEGKLVSYQKSCKYALYIVSIHKCRKLVVSYFQLCILMIVPQSENSIL